MTGTPILRTSERRDFLRCQQRWWWAWREGLRTRGTEGSDALWFGTGVHLALAAWYCGPGAVRGPHPAHTWLQYANDSLRTLKFDRAIDETVEADWISARELGAVLLDEYVKKYGKDEHKLVILPEKTFRIPVPWPKDQNLYPAWTPPTGAADIAELLFIYCGTFDNVWRHADTGQIWLDEHKTAKQIATGHLSLDPQAGSYWAIATRALRDEGLIGPRERLIGIEYNFLRKALPDDRPQDAEGYYCNKPTKADYIEAFLNWSVDAGHRTLAEDLQMGEATLKKLKLEQLELIAREHEYKILGERSKVQGSPLFERHPVLRGKNERASQLIRLQQEGLHMAAIKDGVLPVLKNPDRSCNQGAFRCQFFEMCELHEAGADWEGYKEAAFRVEDPYADHR